MQSNLLDYQPQINSSYANANELWKQEAEAAIQLLIKVGNDLTSEDVLDLLERKGVHTKEKRALGAIFQRYSRQGHLRFIRYTKATRVSRHNAPIALWRPVTRLARV